MTSGPGDETPRAVSLPPLDEVPGYDPEAGRIRTYAAVTGSRLDDWWERVSTRPGVLKLWHWGGPLLVTIVAALLRLVGLNYPHQLVFDETYYVKDAWTLSHLGYEAAWPAYADKDFANGITDGYSSDQPAFVAHPPIGKWIISIGLALFGAQDSIGWRISIAVCGILLVVLTMVIAKKLFRSTLMAVIAGGLLAIDGNAIVLSRVALLDTAVALFALIGVWFVLLDRDWSKRRLDRWIDRRSAAGRSIDWGPALWWRPWLIAAGLAFGITSGIKWSGLYFLAVYAVYALVTDLLARRKAGVTFFATSTILKQGPVTFLLMVPIALVTYVASWTGWFVTAGGYYRHWIQDQGGQAWNGILSWVPYSFQNWWHYQASMYGYNTTVHTPHAYQANPLTWLFLVRPTSMYYQSTPNVGAETILDIANPLIWWGGTAAVFFLLVRLIIGAVRGRSVWRDGFILTGMVAGYLPWLLYLDRTVFQFYSITFEPYMILALTAALGALMGKPTDLEARRVAGLRFVGGFLIVCVAVSAFFLPVWTAENIPYWFMRLHFWFPSWA